MDNILNVHTRSHEKQTEHEQKQKRWKTTQCCDGCFVRHSDLADEPLKGLGKLLVVEDVCGGVQLDFDPCYTIYCVTLPLFWSLTRQIMCHFFLA